MIFNTILLVAHEGAAKGTSGGGGQMLIFIAAMILIFYFFMIRPQQKKQKQVEQMRKELGKGNKVVTVGGIHGVITDTDETTFTIEIADNIKIKVDKAAISVDPSSAKK